MKYLIGKSRTQADLFPLPLEQQIASENEIRFIDAFVDSLDLGNLGFRTHFTENGRPAYHPKHLLKLYMYGYLNGIRSSRKLEKESHRNIEVMWLIESLRPDHNTISNFRRDNPKAIKRVFRETVKTAKSFNLIGGQLIAGDSTKLRAQNSKKNNYNEKKIKRHLDYIDKKLEQYESELTKNDGDRTPDEKYEIEQQIAKHTDQKEKYEQIKETLDKIEDVQISTSDPDSRHLIIRNNITEVAYNIQDSVDDANKIIIDYKVTNENDKQAMGNMVCRAKTILQIGEFTALYDKGYHTGEQLLIAQNLGVTTHVAIPKPSAQAPDPNYNVDKFSYNRENNTFTCPQGHTMTTTGTWHKSKYSNFQQFKTKACKTCPVLTLCTRAKTKQRIIERTQYQDNIELNRKNIEANPNIYKQRQAIVEHPFGTIKRQWGFDHIMTKKGIQRASADVGLIFIAYNIRRLLSLIDLKDLIKGLKSRLLKMLRYAFHKFVLRHSNFLAIIINLKKDMRLERLILASKFKMAAGF